MITAVNVEASTQTRISNDVYSFDADTTEPKGMGQGFRPHELLEAALASCTAITLRLVAKERGIPLKRIRIQIELDRKDPGSATFRSKIDLGDEITEVDRKTLFAAARLCPVRKTLGRQLVFEEAGA
ncbi:OsmC family protein [Mesorhizobium sp. NPDC059054]|uniref:OsmC family protein n=1 Tax=Mesorhizobium sp. NPDC059054 TaxID=3346711 RepID=UPI0036CEB5A6